jgi:hypothetical protein
MDWQSWQGGVISGVEECQEKSWKKRRGADLKWRLGWGIVLRGVAVGMRAERGQGPGQWRGSQRAQMTDSGKVIDDESPELFQD